VQCRAAGPATAIAGLIAREQQRGGVRFCFCRAAMAARAQQQRRCGGRALLPGATSRQPEQNSTAGCASTERTPRQPEGTIARRHALLHGATSAARAQQHGGVRFCLHRAPRQPEHSSALACASTERRSSQGTAGSQHSAVEFTVLMPQSTTQHSSAMRA
jgi:hypothetical protein